MEILQKILDSGKENIYLDRSGPASCADLACAALRSGRSVVLVGTDNSAVRELAALARIFVPDLSAEDYPVNQPIWARNLVSFPDIRHFTDRSAWTRRLASLYGLLQQGPLCVVTGFQNLLLRYMPKAFFSEQYADFTPGQEISPDLILEQAVAWGYERVPMVSAPGEMALRGDILDIYAAGYAAPCRLEFFGDQLEEMRLFDPDSQRSLMNITELTLIPASPIPYAPGEIQKIEKRFSALEKAGKLDENEAYTLKKTLDKDGFGILPGLIHEKSSSFEDWLPQDALWILRGELESIDELMGAWERLKGVLEDETSDIQQPAALALRRKSQPVPWNGKQCVFVEPLRIGIEERGIRLPEQIIHSFTDLFPRPEDRDRPWQTFVRALKGWQSEYRQIILTFPTSRTRKKFIQLADQEGIVPLTRYNPDQSGLYALISPFRLGSKLEWAQTLILGEDIIFPRASKAPRKASRVFKGLDNFENIKPGDLLVHRDYGIGRFNGLCQLNLNNATNDFLLLEYAGNDKLYVPVDSLSLIQRFKGQEGVSPALDRLGTQAWVNGKEKARKAIEKIAQDLVEMYAYRKVAKSFHYNPPGELYHEFEATFNFEETPDQARAINEVINDMDKNVPMDRLVCGDVGFGKTEVALRAAFRAASEGRQVALLCPTTVLAEQHYQTFKSRLAGFPINVGLLSRFVPRAKQKEVLQGCAQGQIDILIGTHRLLSNDVKLPNLALLILDEEQRFGVRHKEKLKSIKKNVDVLTLTATPIPRTLQLSMSGIRDLSIIETPPVDRKPVSSALIQRDPAMLKQVIQRELDRQGQVFWVYNRVHDLERVTEYVRNLVPEARIGMAHGQMAEGELETTMRKFWHGELDVLVCTSIVESGLDFPRANTLIVDQAQMFGLGQLYQLRGRVGRSDRQAYAYFVVPDTRHLSELAEERLRIILDMDYLGAGFQVAMEDLRLRGAGNILGEAQSGHITRIGLDLYLEMLEEEVARIKGEPSIHETETEMTLGVSAHIPESYISDNRERLKYYKILSSTADHSEREEIALTLRDRFGPFPEELKNFLAILEFKSFIGKMQVEKAEIRPDFIKLAWSKDQTAVKGDQIIRLITDHPEIKLLPPASLSIPLAPSLPLSEALREARELLEILPARN